MNFDEDIEKYLLTSVREFTATNDHTEARLRVAAFFEDWRGVRAFEAIETLHSALGYLDPNLDKLRNTFTNQLLFRIEHKHGSEIKDAIKAAL